MYHTCKVNPCILVSIFLTFLSPFDTHATKSGHDSLQSFLNTSRFYDELGVKDTSTPEEIQEAYIQKLVKTHPNKITDKTLDESSILGSYANVTQAYHGLRCLRNSKLANSFVAKGKEHEVKYGKSRFLLHTSMPYKGGARNTEWFFKDLFKDFNKNSTSENCLSHHKTTFLDCFIEEVKYHPSPVTHFSFFLKNMDLGLNDNVQEKILGMSLNHADKNGQTLLYRILSKPLTVRNFYILDDILRQGDIVDINKCPSGELMPIELLLKLDFSQASSHLMTQGLGKASADELKAHYIGIFDKHNNLDTAGQRCIMWWWWKTAIKEHWLVVFFFALCLTALVGLGSLFTKRARSKMSKRKGGKKRAFSKRKNKTSAKKNSLILP